ncbi:Hypothetical protein CINCED_3A019124 [Cinara cedri]|uniref:Uncharacterized protein n=1 Tax=Cinara cedri TaxID=506608 RepID=A0A5E4MEJ0_9HEMI|nr:Hypothetical protein CINCED_3A019124 [Cinara cedri]
MSKICPKTAGSVDLPPRDLEQSRYEQFVGVTASGAQIFYTVVEDILCRKEQDERIRKANYNTIIFCIVTGTLQNTTAKSSKHNDSRQDVGLKIRGKRSGQKNKIKTFAKD